MVCRIQLPERTDLAHGGYVGVRLGEARNLGPATHDRDRAAEQRDAGLRRINEAGDPVPGSQDSITRGIQNLQLGDTPEELIVPPAPALAPMPNPRRPPQARLKQQPREYQSCAQCGSDPSAFQSSFRPRPHAAHGSEARGATALPSKRCTATQS